MANTTQEIRDFVLSQPAALRASKIAELAKEAGFKITGQAVGQIRRRQGEQKASKPAAPRVLRAKRQTARPSTEGQFVEAAFEVGLGRAEELLGKLRAAGQTVLASL